jgi:hypothetical protein
MDVTTTSTYVLLAVSWLFPLLSNLINRQHWPTEVVGILTLLVSTAGGFVSEYFQDPSHQHWGNAIGKAFLAYVLAAFAHEKIWKGTTTDRKTLAWPNASPPNGVQPGLEPRGFNDAGAADILIVLLIVAVLLFFGLGFAVKLLWVVAVVALCVLIWRLLVGRSRV